MSRFFISVYCGVREGSKEIDFGIDATIIYQMLGTPLRKRKHYFGDAMLYYEELTITLAKNTGQVTEIAISDKSELVLNQISLFSDADVMRKLVEIDPSPLNGLGFTVFFNLGIAVQGLGGDGGEKVVTVFERGRWDPLIPKLTPFLL